MFLVPFAATLGLAVSTVALASADSPRFGHLVSKDAEALKLKLEMPGLGKEHVKVWADQDSLMIEGKGDKDTEYDDDDKAPPQYSRRVRLRPDSFQMDQVKAEMKDGVLKVIVPKINVDEKRKEMFQVKVE